MLSQVNIKKLSEHLIDNLELSYSIEEVQSQIKDFIKINSKDGKTSKRINKSYRKHVVRYKNCKNCNAEFYVAPSQEKQEYCKSSCIYEYKKKHGIVNKNFIGSADNRGVNNGRYKHGKRQGGHVQKQKLKDKIRKRDGERCLYCDRVKYGLHAHRVKYGSEGGKYEESNVVLLCGEHHMLVHENKKKWKPILLKYLETLDKTLLHKHRSDDSI